MKNHRAWLSIKGFFRRFLLCRTWRQDTHHNFHHFSVTSLWILTSDWLASSVVSGQETWPVQLFPSPVTDPSCWGCRRSRDVFSEKSLSPEPRATAENTHLNECFVFTTCSGVTERVHRLASAFIHVFYGARCCIDASFRPGILSTSFRLGLSFKCLVRAATLFKSLFHLPPTCYFAIQRANN